LLRAELGLRRGLPLERRGVAPVVDAAWSAGGVDEPIEVVSLTTHAYQTGAFRQLAYLTLSQEPGFVVDLQLDTVAGGMNPLDASNALLTAYQLPY
jgi:hypothetical protein